MYSGTGFLTKSGTPAIIYHGESTGKNFVVTANDDGLNSWNAPVAIQTVDLPDGPHDRWDPDCFVIIQYLVAENKNCSDPLIFIIGNMLEIFWLMKLLMLFMVKIYRAQTFLSWETDGFYYV